MFSASSKTSESPTSTNHQFPAYVLPSNGARRSSRPSLSRFSFSRSSVSSSLWSRKSSNVSSTTDEATSTALTSPSTSPRDSDAPSYLKSAASTITCSRCHADLALTSQIVSKGFTGRHGRAYLIACAHESPNIIPTPGSTPYHYNHDTEAAANVGEGGAALPNTTLHRAVSRNLVTGMHKVSDVSCSMCGNVLGWKYVDAAEESQRYKLGKFILESKRTRINACWDGAGMDGVEEDDDFDYGLEGWSSSRGKNREEGEDDIAFDSQDEDECDELFAGCWSPARAKERRAKRAF